MKQGAKSKGTGTWILPLAAVVMIAIMLIVVLFVPKNRDEKSATGSGSVSQVADDVSEINGDGDLVIPAYDLSVKLHEGENPVSFTPAETGTVPYSCWMGMIKSSIKVID